MSGLPDFRARQMDLQKRLGRQRPRSVHRRRLERELRGLVVVELHQELARAAGREISQLFPPLGKITVGAHTDRLEDRRLPASAADNLNGDDEPPPMWWLK